MCKKINFNRCTSPKHSLHHESRHPLRGENKYFPKHTIHRHRVRQEERGITKGNIDVPSFDVRLDPSAFFECG